MTHVFSLPPVSGIGLKPEHYAPMLSACREEGGIPPGWVEVHPQNYFGAGGPPHRWLEAVAEMRPLSFHSTGLSLGSAQGPDLHDLELLAHLAERYQPAHVSDHLSWSNGTGDKFPDLLPIPYTHEALARVSANIAQVQDRLKRKILIENPSRYLAFAADEWAETDFINALCDHTGCGLLLDINNVDVSATNLNFSAEVWLDAINSDLVAEIHLAGHATEMHADGTTLKIDDHGSPVSDRCWDLFSAFVSRSGPLPTLIERDTNLPAYKELIAEAEMANARLSVHGGHDVCPA